MKAKKNTYYLLLILTIALGLRVFAAASVPLIYDEQNYVKAATEIKTIPNIFNLQIKGETSIRSPDQSWNTNREGVVRYHLATLITVNLSKVLFGNSVLGMRLLFVIFGILSLFFIYKTVEEESDFNRAFLVLLILTFSQLHIGISRLMLHSPYHFFVTLAIYSFFKALKANQNQWVYLTGISIGLGFLYYPWIIFLVVVFSIFLISKKRYRIWFKKKATYLSFLIMCSIILPYIFWTSHEFIYKITVDKNVSQLGFSLRAFYLYFGELFSFFSDKFGVLHWDGLSEKLFLPTTTGLRLLGEIELEFPVIHWVLGLAIFSGLFYSLKSKKSELIRFSLLMFCLFFVVISIVNGKVLFLDYSWADITIYPGVILCANLLMGVGERWKSFYFLGVAFIIYLIGNSISFINIPENFYAVPKSELSKLYLRKSKFYLHSGDKKRAEKLLSLSHEQ